MRRAERKDEGGTKAERPSPALGLQPNGAAKPPSAGLLPLIDAGNWKTDADLAATVDYLFGYDATAGVAEDWMYGKLAQSYVFDPAMREFFAEKNPWALAGIIERLEEAIERGLWEQPSEEELARPRDACLENETAPGYGARRWRPRGGHSERTSTQPTELFRGAHLHALLRAHTGRRQASIQHGQRLREACLDPGTRHDPRSNTRMERYPVDVFPLSSSPRRRRKPTESQYFTVPSGLSMATAICATVRS